jgi:hypothetical protein
MNAEATPDPASVIRLVMVTVPPATTVAGDTLSDWIVGGVVSFPPATVKVPPVVGGVGELSCIELSAASDAPKTETVQVAEAAANGTVRVVCQIPS